MTDFLSTRDVALMLQCTEGFVQNLVEEGLIPYFGAGLFEKDKVLLYKEEVLARRRSLELDDGEDPNE